MTVPRVWRVGALLSGLLALALSAPLDGVQKVIALDQGVQEPPRIPQSPLLYEQNSAKQLRGRFLHISDLHPDEFYKLHSSTDADFACHRGNGSAGKYGAETSDCDSPSSLINATFDWIADNLKDEIDFIIWTGDSARHDSDEEIPRSPAQVLGTNRWVADKFAETFADPDNGNRLSIPIVPTLGNNDILPHNILLPGPNKWLQYYTDVWRRFIPEEQRHSFEFGGWFYVEVVPDQLAVFSLNTLYFFDRNAGVDDCAHPSEPGYKQMEWLRVQLQFLRRRGMKAILMGHVPPARTDSKQLWSETCWQKYTLWLKQYRDVVVASLYGHMNIDHFMVQDTEDIDIRQLTGEDAGEGELKVRMTMEDELSIVSSADYLQELRSDWAKLPKPVTAAVDDADTDKKKKKKKKKGKPYKDFGGKWAERYQLTLIGPSIVPNYFPTLRILEYNITGLQDSPRWSDDSDAASVRPPHMGLAGEDFRQLTKEIELAEERGREKKKQKKPAHDPNLVIPEPPEKKSLPGPAYQPQTLSLTGYTQLYANLTYINNDMTHNEDDDASHNKWRDGIHRDKLPKSKKPHPHKFEFKEEYNTFNDSVFKLPDLTVKSYVHLAYRIGQHSAKEKALADDFEGDDHGGMYDDEDGIHDYQEEGDAAAGKATKPKKPNNKVWIYFLSNAFVRTVAKEDLKKL